LIQGLSWDDEACEAVGFFGGGGGGENRKLEAEE
jgi:hypothetical protein